jgi:hypothetical protein
VKSYQFKDGKMIVICDCGEVHKIDLARGGEIKTKVDKAIIEASIEIYENLTLGCLECPVSRYDFQRNLECIWSGCKYYKLMKAIESYRDRKENGY